MKYKFKTVRGKRPLVEVEFEEERYELLGEMLIAERGLLGELTEVLDSVHKSRETETATFSGNAFSVYIEGKTAKITNDINCEEAEAPTEDLRKLTKAYKKHYDKL